MRIAIALLLVAAVALGAGALSLAGGSHCTAPVSVSCHRGHDQQGNPTDPCNLYVDLGANPPGIICL